MFDIAICDDERQICNNLQQFVKRAEISKSEEFNIDLFDSGESLTNALATKKQYDLIFLDVNLKTINGADIGNHIRDVLKYNLTQIVYISSEDSYAMSLFESRPQNFLLKPIKYEAVLKEIEKAINAKGVQETTLTGRKNDIKYKVKYNDIIYLESDNKIVCAHTAFGEITINAKLSDLLKDLPDNFIVVHKSIVANYNYIKRFAYDNVCMSTGEILPISSVNRRLVRMKLMNLSEVSRKNEIK